MWLVGSHPRILFSLWVAWVERWVSTSLNSKINTESKGVVIWATNSCNFPWSVGDRFCFFNIRTKIFIFSVFSMFYVLNRRRLFFLLKREIRTINLYIVTRQICSCWPKISNIAQGNNFAQKIGWNLSISPHRLHRLTSMLQFCKFVMSNLQICSSNLSAT